MRTWSVSGTAFALCTRSSSLSMRTRTSIGSYSCGFSGVPGRPSGKSSMNRLATGPGTSSSTLPPNAAISFTQLVAPSGHRGELQSAARRDEADLRAHHHVDGLDVGSQRPVQLIHLELPL